MRTLSALYRRLSAAPGHTKEIKAVVAGETYSQDDIISCAVTCGLFSEASIGQCVARELDLIVQSKGDIPRMARIDLSYRLTLGDEATEWLPKGAYYLSLIHI